MTGENIAVKVVIYKKGEIYKGVIYLIKLNPSFSLSLHP